jgi:methylmalonyl-CoA/ethylmalonyl-CoA epimerase
MLKGIDHIAIAVENTEAALPVWCEMFGLTIRHSEIVNNSTVKLTHLSGAGIDIQLVEPLTEDHPLKAWLKENGSGLHHICFSADVDKPIIENVKKAGLTPNQSEPHQGIMGKWALFLDRKTTDNVIVEITGE